jgi:hypothetical protein
MTRLAHAWRALAREQRLTAIAALGLFFSMFLPWYSKTDTFLDRQHGALKHANSSLSAFGAFSFVEAAVLLVSAGVLAMLFARAERRSFRLPGGDGLIVLIAGGWAAALIFYRLLDKPGLQGNEKITATVGVQWGIFIALLVALGLAYCGARLRGIERAAGGHEDTRGRGRGKAHRGSAEGAAGGPGEAGLGGRADGEGATTVVPASEHRQARGRPAPATPGGAERSRREVRRPRYPPAPGEQMSLEDSPPAPEH